MKKLWFLTICLITAGALAGCGGSSNSAQNRTTNQPAGVKEILEAQTTAEDAKASGEENTTSGPNKDAPLPEVPAAAEMALSQTEGIDIDLTSLPAAIVYSEVYHMMAAPEDYIGKTVKMNGAFSYYHDETTGNEYFTCIIKDATACCAQGIEFILSDEYSYPDDYPELGGEICVVGTFDTYMEGQYRYCTLRNAERIL